MIVPYSTWTKYKTNFLPKPFTFTEHLPNSLAKNFPVWRSFSSLNLCTLKGHILGHYFSWYLPTDTWPSLKIELTICVKMFYTIETSKNRHNKWLQHSWLKMKVRERRRTGSQVKGFSKNAYSFKSLIVKNIAW